MKILSAEQNPAACTAGFYIHRFYKNTDHDQIPDGSDLHIEQVSQLIDDIVGAGLDAGCLIDPGKFLQFSCIAVIIGYGINRNLKTGNDFFDS